jgi:indole-3-glycerol phosphate synthase
MTEIADILRRIVDQRRLRIEAALAAQGRSLGPEDQELPESAGPSSFMEAIRSAAAMAVIAEVKLGSPRLGPLRDVLDPERQARLYAESGAAAISVVVEPDFFYGSYELLSRCQQASGLPALAKDFIVHPIQLEWAQQSGAAAVLLIAALHTKQELAKLAAQARQLGLVPLVECHSREDLVRLNENEWELIGVNNRDLRTFEVNLEHSMEMIPDLPAEAVKVAESGIRSGMDVQKLSAAGFDAFLVGESLLLAEDPSTTLRELVGAGEG